MLAGFCGASVVGTEFLELFGASGSKWSDPAFTYFLVGETLK